MSKKEPNNVKYKNWWSKLLYKKKFEDQFYIATPQSFAEKSLLSFIENFVFDDSYKKLKIEKPIFIVGLPRSGTTLLYNLLAYHEQSTFVTNSMNNSVSSLRAIEWARKKFKLNIEGERFFKDSINTNFGSPSEPIMLWGKWFERDIDSLYWEKISKSQLGQEKINVIEDDIKKIMSTFQVENPRFVCKYPVMQPDLLLLNELFPDAKFIHIIRDPREVANSLIKLYKISNAQLDKINHPLLKSIIPYPRVKSLKENIEKYGADNIACTSHIWNDALELVHEQKDQLSNFYELKYENLLENPGEVMSKLFSFCELSQPVKSNNTYYSEFKKIGKVNHKNNYKDFDQVEKICAPLMHKYKYR